jgi:hypothetical protein
LHGGSIPGKRRPAGSGATEPRGYLNGKVGEEVEVETSNVSPNAPSLSRGCERELRQFFAPEYELYGQSVG